MNTKQSVREKQTGLFASRLIVWIFLLITVYPILFVVLTSLKSTKDFYTNAFGLPKVWMFVNYAEAWNAAHIGQYFANTTVVSVLTTLMVLFLSCLAGYALARLEIPRADLIVLLMMGVTLLPSESVIMPMYLTISRMRLIGTLASLIVPYVGWWLPTNIFIMRNFFATTPGELLESARVDGASEMTVFLRILAPLMVPAIGTCTVICFSGIWGELLWASVVLSTTSLRTLSLGILAFQGQFSTNWGLLSAAVCVVLLPILALFIAFQKYFVQGLTTGAVKG